MENNMLGIDRFILVRKGCPFCLMAKKAVLFINRYLPYDKRIQIIDNFEWEEFRFPAHPFVDSRLDPKTFDGYPYIYIGGVEIEPATTEILIITIATLVSEDLVMEINFEGKIISPGERN